MITIAAVGDVHFSEDLRGSIIPSFEVLSKDADCLLLAGDLTLRGETAEAKVLSDELRDCPVPVVAVLGNHDYHLGKEQEITELLRESGVTVLEGESLTLELDGGTVGIAGTKGFGGGFMGACATEFGEGQMKNFVSHSRELAQRLKSGLDQLSVDTKIALTHYSPIEETLQGERLEIYPFLGSYLIAEAIDSGGADLAIHGHAHNGRPKGVTAGGVRVRNVARPVIRRPFSLFRFSQAELTEPDPHPWVDARSGVESHVNG